ncbi:MAG: Protein containing Heat shock protein Hsp20 protein [Parcubacteria bacterium C7867-001]|nr:MAG: Protein containing Heat shock protein Hsp20 protein [Parcubacteria bacterium C7867-001]
MKKGSFFQRISGAVPLSDEYDSFDEEVAAPKREGGVKKLSLNQQAAAPQPMVHEEEPQAAEGQLPVDVYQTQNEIIIRSFVAGVRPDELNVSISRDMVVIEGSREERERISGPDYFSQELFWGSFTRTVLLPQEIDVDNSVASCKDGLLSITLPKLDRTRQTKLRVKAG